MQDVSHKLKYLSNWSPVVGSPHGRNTSLRKVLESGLPNLTSRSISLLHVSSVISQFPAPAAMPAIYCHASNHVGFLELQIKIIVFL